MKERPLNTRQAAAYCGCHPNTVRNWADLGFVACEKTEGGHRRYLKADLEPLKNYMESHDRTRS